MKIRGKLRGVFTNDYIHLTEVVFRFSDLRDEDIQALHDLLNKHGVMDVEIKESQGPTLA